MITLHVANHLSPTIPLSPNSDQDQFSPNIIHTLLSVIKFSQLILYGNVWRSVWRICMRILGLKGLKEVIKE